MPPNRPKRHKQSEIDTLPDGRDIPHYVENWSPLPKGRYKYKVTCRRRVSPGQFTVTVEANSPEQAKEYVRDGNVPGVGLGWIPQKVELLS